MTTLSTRKLEKYLDEYSLHLEYWSADDGDGNELLGCREILQVQQSALSPFDINRLSQLDSKAIAIIADYKGPETFDIAVLRKVVDIAKSGHQKAA